MSGIKAVIFDMDGVLIEARDWHYEALNQALGLFGYRITRYEHLVTFDGLPTRKKLEILTMERGLPAKLHSFINEMKQEFTLNFIFTRCKPRFIHQYALNRLKGLGLRLAVCSNSVRRTIDIMLEKARIDEFFELTLSNEDVRHPKPHPEIYQAAIRKLGLEPAECLVVEDNEYGIQAGKAAGAQVMKVNDVHEVNFENINRYVLHHTPEGWGPETLPPGPRPEGAKP